MIWKSSYSEYEYLHAKDGIRRRSSDQVTHKCKVFEAVCSAEHSHTESRFVQLKWILI